MRTTSRLTAAAVLGAVVGGVVLGGAPAVAAWNQSGTGMAAARATSLTAPSDVSATGASGTTMTITWSAPQQLPGATYEVVRDDATTLSCTSSPCTDTGLQGGTTYDYVVTAKLGAAWTRSAAPVSGTTVQVGATALDVTVASNVTAGASTLLGLRATRADGSTDTSFSGFKSIRVTGDATAASPTGASPGLPNTALFAYGVALVPASFVSAGSDLDLTVTAGSISGTATTTVRAAAPAGLLPVTMTAAGQDFACKPSAPVGNSDCGPWWIGNNVDAKFAISLIDAYGNAATATSNVRVTGQRLGTMGTLTAPGSTTIPAGAPSTGLWNFKANGSWTSITLRFTTSDWVHDLTVRK